MNESGDFIIMLIRAASGKAPILAVFKILVAHLLPAGRRTPQHVGSDPYKLKNRYYAFTKRNYFRFMISL